MKFFMKTSIVVIMLLACALLVRAELVASVSPVKIAGQKAIVGLHFQNNFTNAIESARAVCFLQDSQGKMIGETTKWVIGEKKSVLKAGASSSFNFVITAHEPFADTNLTAKISFIRITLDNGSFVNARDVIMTNTNK